MNDAQLRDLSRSAYEAELNGDFNRAHSLHEAAVAGLKQLVQQLSRLWTGEREEKRVANKQLDLHQERLRMLQPIVNGKGIPPNYVAPPSAVSAVRDLDVSREPRTLSADELVRPQEPPPLFTSSLNPSLPIETYYIYEKNQFKQGFQRWFMYTVRDASDQQSLYILEGCYTHNRQIPSTNFYRVGDYPSSCIQVVPTPVQPKRYSHELGAGLKGRVLTLRASALPHPIVETPDRLEKQPWGPRRFVYGGRKFVWKVGSKSEDWRPESLYEYTRKWPKPGSRTGKQEDDALEPRIFWSDKMPFAQRHARWTIHCVGGLDQVFKEHILASQITKLICLYTDAI